MYARTHFYIAHTADVGRWLVIGWVTTKEDHTRLRIAQSSLGVISMSTLNYKYIYSLALVFRGLYQSGIDLDHPAIALVVTSMQLPQPRLINRVRCLREESCIFIIRIINPKLAFVPINSPVLQILSNSDCA